MKIKKKAAIAAAFLTMANFSACDNVGSGVYGPPPDEQEIEQQNDTETVSGEDVSQSETNTDNSETTEEEDVQ